MCEWFVKRFFRSQEAEALGCQFCAHSDLRDPSCEKKKNGFRAEDLKRCDEETKEWMRDIFNMIIKRDFIARSSWTKGGDQRPKKPENYRPIAHTADVVQIFLHDAVQPTVQQARQVPAS